MADCLATHILKFRLTSGKDFAARQGRKDNRGPNERVPPGNRKRGPPVPDNASGTGGPRAVEAGLRELAGGPLRVGVGGGTGWRGAAFVGPVLAG